MTSIYKLALQVQDASNMSGVANSFVNEVLPAVRQEEGYRLQGTHYLHGHPAVLLFLDKMVSLTGQGWITDPSGEIAAAYARCHEMVDLEARQQRGDFSTEKFEVA